MLKRGLAPGAMTFVGVETRIGRERLRLWTERYGAVTIFHPLRLVAAGCMISRKEEFEASDDEELGRKLIKGPCIRRLQRDVKRASNQLFNNLLIELLAFGTVKLVLHTEYELPLWCSSSFRSAMVNATRKVLESLPGEALALGQIHVTVEVHPGIGGLRDCSVKLYPQGRHYVRVSCKEAPDSGEMYQCLEEAVMDFKELAGLAKSFSIALEPRGGSVVTVRGKRLPQCLSAHLDALRAANRLGTYIVVDPNQHVGGFDEGFNDALRLVSMRPDLVEEIHVHNKHAPISDREAKMYSRLIKDILAREGPLTSIVGEITRPSLGSRRGWPGVMPQLNLEAVESLIRAIYRTAGL